MAERRLIFINSEKITKPKSSNDRVRTGSNRHIDALIEHLSGSKNIDHAPNRTVSARINDLKVGDQIEMQLGSTHQVLTFKSKMPRLQDGMVVGYQVQFEELTYLIPMGKEAVLHLIIGSPNRDVI